MFAERRIETGLTSKLSRNIYSLLISMDINIPSYSLYTNFAQAFVNTRHDSVYLAHDINIKPVTYFEMLKLLKALHHFLCTI